MAALALPAILLVFSTGAGATTSVSAVQKVIQLLENMQANAKAMKNKEEVGFAAFKQFCTDTIANKENDIKKANELIESLTAEIEKLETDVAELSKQIGDLHDQIETDEASLKKKAADRKEEAASQTEMIEDLAESVDALDRAISVLQKQDFDRKQAAEALLQVSNAAGMQDSVQRTIAAFLEMQTGDDFLTRDAPEANAYEFQSGGILSLLKKLHEEFIAKHTEAQKAKMNSQHAYDMIAQDLTDSIENANADIADKTADLDEKKILLAEDKKQLTTVTKDRDEDMVYLKDLKVECEEKAKSFDEKQRLRAEEIEAIAKAIEILSSPDVLGSAEKHLPASLVQQTAKSSLAQLAPDGLGTMQHVLAGFLKHESKRLHSKHLGMLAETVASTSSANPFIKVKKMIESLIQNLLREAGEESEHKGWCDTELGTNKITRTKLQDTIDGLTAKIDETDSSIIKMTQRIAELDKEVVELNTAMKEASELREAEKSKNEKTIEDAMQAQKAVEAATAILKDFYEKAGEATALLQKGPFDPKAGTEEVKMGSEEWNSLANPNVDAVDRGHKAGMQTFGATYKGQQDEAGGVLAMLEVVHGDFSQLEAETSAAETAAADEHREFMATSNKSVAVKTKEVDMLTSDKTEAEAELSSAKSDLAGTQDQLLAADRYYEKLKPTCVDTGISYEERVKARQEEIQSLQEALKILQGYDLP